MKKMLMVLFLGNVLFLAASCGPRAGQDVAELITQARSMADGGDVDKALERLSPYYSSRNYVNDRTSLLRAMIQIEVNAGRNEAALARFRAAAKKNPQHSEPLIGPIVSFLISQKKWDFAGQILEMVNVEFKDTPSRRAAVGEARINLTLAKDGYKRALEEIPKYTKDLPDEGASRVVGSLGRAVVAARDRTAVDTLYALAMAAPAGYDKTRTAGAECSVQMIVRHGTPRELASRLEDIQRRGVPPGVIIHMINSNYPMLLGRGEPDVYQSLFTLCETLEKGRLSDFEKLSLGGVMLDISYYLGNFEAALSLIERGAGGMDADQRAQLIPKIRAHVAMKKNQPLEAVKYFREFMVTIAKRNRDEVDPVNNCCVTSDMILGLNAKRIGDLLTSAGDTTEAGKAYQEAREYYQKALQRFNDPASAENRKIVQEMAEIPGK